MTSEPLNQYTEVCKVTDKHYSRVFLQLGAYLLHGILLAKSQEVCTGILSLLYRPAKAER